MDKVRPRDPLRIPAEFINRTIDTNELVRQRDLRPPGPVRPFPPGIIPVRNDSGLVRQALDPIHVSGYAAATTDPFSIPVFVGLLDAALPHWGICLERIDPGEVGRVQVSGVTSARLTVLDPTHPTVKVSASGLALETSANGSAALLGAASGYGTIILAAASGSGGSGLLFVQISGLHPASPSSGTVALIGSAYAAPAGGVAIATGATILVYGVAAGTLQASDFSGAPRMAAVALGSTTWTGTGGAVTEAAYTLLNTLHALV